MAESNKLDSEELPQTPKIPSALKRFTNIFIQEKKTDKKNATNNKKKKKMKI